MARKPSEQKVRATTIALLSYFFLVSLLALVGSAALVMLFGPSFVELSVGVGVLWLLQVLEEDLVHEVEQKRLLGERSNCVFAV